MENINSSPPPPPFIRPEPKQEMKLEENENLDNSLIIIQKKNQELTEFIEKGSNIKKKLTRFPFYKLEKMKHIEEKKLKNIHKTEKKEKDAKTAFTHDAHYIERRKHKRTRKQK